MLLTERDLSCLTYVVGTDCRAICGNLFSVILSDEWHVHQLLRTIGIIPQPLLCVMMLAISPTVSIRPQPPVVSYGADNLSRRCKAYVKAGIHEDVLM